MKKILFTLIAFVACLATEAKVVKITLADGTVKVYTSSQLSSIDFNDDGTLVITTWNGQELPPMEGTFEEVNIDEQEMVYEEKMDVYKMDVDMDGTPIKLNSERSVVRLNYVYPSTDPFGDPITLSGTIVIPEDIWNGTHRSEGILLFNHYTIFHRDEAPTRGYAQLEGLFLGNHLKPNYILVESDFYGFGVTERFPQAFLQGTHNARASLDGLLAARRILEERGFDYGPLCFNLGYSSGGFDALATQKLRDMEYKDVISFDKTFAGGSPTDLAECYRQYVEIDSTAYNAVPLLLMVSTKETQNLDIEYDEVFQPYLAGQIDELINSKSYSSWPVCDIIGREKKIHEILTAPYCDLSSEQCQRMLRLFDKFGIATDWVPDPTQRLFIYHSRDDDYVPVQSARGIISFLSARGFTPSIIPGKTNLQTNFFVKKMGHLTATTVYWIQSLAAIYAWPQMYTNGQLNPIYAAIINQQIDIVPFLRQLEALGIDTRSFVRGVAAKVLELMASSGQEVINPADLSPVSLMLILGNELAKYGIDLQEVMEICADSGIDVTGFVVNLYNYFMEDPTPAEGGEAEASETPNPLPSKLLQTPADIYEQELRDWLKENKR
ncbi:MAG: hypothetical protein IJR02_03860 [Bacteroidaceae bacterium]|nr:hypothetical protein [Bacteroidaceae bacterium]